MGELQEIHGEVKDLGGKSKLPGQKCGGRNLRPFPEKYSTFLES